MTRRRSKAFGLILVMAVLVVAAAALFMANEGVRTMIFRSRFQADAAARRNLQRSAAAWADRAALKPGESKGLPMDALKIKGGAAKVTRSADGKTLHIQTTYATPRGPVTHKTTRPVSLKR